MFETMVQALINHIFLGGKIMTKLAEALILRADLQKRLTQLEQRILRNAKVQEGDSPAETPMELLAEAEQVSEELTEIIQRINQTNSITELETGQTLADALAVRDVLRLRYNLYRQLAQEATVTQGRFTRSEIKFQSAIEVATVQKQADDLAKEYRELDTKTQACNWVTDLIA
jgi:formiminotetrahydrofolate cyclodeaminase